MCIVKLASKDNAHGGRIYIPLFLCRLAKQLFDTNLLHKDI